MHYDELYEECKNGRIAYLSCVMTEFVSVAAEALTSFSLALRNGRQKWWFAKMKWSPAVCPAYRLGGALAGGEK